jgi:hypothetical protein
MQARNGWSIMLHGLAWNYISYFAVATVLVVFGMRALRDRAQRERDAFQRAIPGVARVLKVGNSTPSRSYGAYVMDLLIQVHRPGLEPYELSTMWSVQPGSVAKMQAGQTFAIKIDPQNREKIYSGESWAHSLGVMKTPISKSSE